MSRDRRRRRLRDHAGHGVQIRELCLAHLEDIHETLGHALDHLAAQFHAAEVDKRRNVRDKACLGTPRMGPEHVQQAWDYLQANIQAIFPDGHVPRDACPICSLNGNRR